MIRVPASVATLLGFDNSNYIHPTCVIFPGVRMGKGNYFGPGCIIGGPAEHAGSWDPLAVGRVVIGDCNRFTGHVTIDSAVKVKNETGPADEVQGRPFTLIGDDCFLMKHTHVGHDARVGNRVTMAPGAVVGGHAYICQGVTLGVNSFVHQRQVVADFCMIGAGAAMGKDLETKPLMTYAGVPAKLLKPNYHQINKLDSAEMDEMQANFAANLRKYLEETGRINPFGSSK